MYNNDVTNSITCGTDIQPSHAYNNCCNMCNSCYNNNGGSLGQTLAQDNDCSLITLINGVLDPDFRMPYGAYNMSNAVSNIKKLIAKKSESKCKPYKVFENKKGEDKNMSIACMMIKDGKIMAFSDSRSTSVAFENGHKVNRYDDKFQKTCYLQGLNIAAVSTGVNTFYNIPFPEFVEKMFNAHKDEGCIKVLDTINQNILQSLSGSNIGTIVNYGFFQELSGIGMQPVVAECLINNNGDGKITVCKHYSANVIFSSGKTWATTFISDIPSAYLKSLSFDDSIRFVENLISDIIMLENNYQIEPVIGGSVQKLIIGENGKL